jgi:hypothetical protein
LQQLLPHLQHAVDGIALAHPMARAAMLFVGLRFPLAGRALE